MISQNMQKQNYYPRIAQKKNKSRLEITDEQRQELKEDFHEFKTILKALGFEVNKQHILDIIKSYDSQNTGYLSFPDYMNIMTEKIANRDPLEEIALAFKLFDDDDSGYITVEKLKKISMQLGEDLTDEELKSMIDEFDKDMDGATIMTQAALF